ncbi:uncharacterized oxidoreductase At4g09670-like [Impatiens glandulifera]|uniref:uncharacterized oxidoreductase At4g09670-like n=1 Tax=Impatiens glandulifera TaxID=253017 RepID=UPI001FB08FF8|nr:uncharacterized oxidoreductase At4g09670-like [Impatiens glandulifera]XP_047314682.1 uncharacterized oxidoreductase At4g09670-like [Impatiens glandulifera]
MFIGVATRLLSMLMRVVERGEITWLRSAEIHTVCSRSQEKTTLFASDNGETYEAVLDDPDVDIAYILEACEENDFQFMDSTMWMHNPRTAKMREFHDDPLLFGQLKKL